MALAVLFALIGLTAPSPTQGSGARTLDRSKAVPIVINKGKSSNLNDQDPKATFMIAGGPNESNYEIFRFEAVAQSKLTADLTLYASGAFSKRELAATIVILDPSETELPFSARALVPRSNGWIDALWDFSPTQTGTHFVVVAADQRQVGKRLAQIDTGGVIGMLLPIPITGSASGRYSIRIDESRKK